MTWVVDMDDQCNAWDALPYLLAIKEKYSKFKVTLFTIPGDSTVPHLLELKKHDWIELALHGWNHRIDYIHNPTEMKTWDYEKTIQYFNFIETFYPGIFATGFKAPGWQISDDTYRAALERGYWVMDQHYNDNRRPTDLPVYCVGSGENIHGHTWDCWKTVDNFIEDMIVRGDFDKITQADDFKFVSEVVA